MVSGFLNRQHANRLMLEQGLSALVLAQPESIIYASGAFPGVDTNWRRSGAAFLVVLCDATEPLTAIVGDLQADAFKAHSKIADRCFWLHPSPTGILSRRHETIA